jgi:hypothetical protein
MRFQVACSTERACGIALGAIRGDSCEERLAPDGHGVVDVGDRVFPTSRTDPLGSFQGGHARGKTPPTLPMCRNDRLEVHRPVALMGE